MRGSSAYFRKPLKSNARADEASSSVYVTRPIAASSPCDHLDAPPTRARVLPSQLEAAHCLPVSLKRTADASLSLISSAPGNLQPVFDATLANAARLCDAVFGNLNLYDGNAFHFAASYNQSPSYVELRKREPFRPSLGSAHGRVVATKEVVHTLASQYWGRSDRSIARPLGTVFARHRVHAL
jgi:hypothetical protein